MRHRLHGQLIVAALATATVAYASAQTSTAGAMPEILVLSSSEDASGTTQQDFSPEVLKMLEQRSVAILETKTRAYLKSQGQPTQLPKFQSEAQYVQVGTTKLAVVRIKYPRSVNQVMIYGIKGTEFHRVACARTINFDESIPLFYGACSDRIREVFGVSINPR